MDNDWIANFFDKCRLVSDAEMQGLWSRVLAGEANAPGSYSKRAVNFLSDLDRAEAESFTKLCGFGWKIEHVVPLVFDAQAEICNRYGINFNTLSHLESISIVQFNDLAGFVRQKLPKKFDVFYYGRALGLEMPGELTLRAIQRRRTLGPTHAAGTLGSRTGISDGTARAGRPRVHVLLRA